MHENILTRKSNSQNMSNLLPSLQPQTTVLSGLYLSRYKSYIVIFMKYFIPLVKGEAEEDLPQSLCPVPVVPFQFNLESVFTQMLS
jgi:hypothetical protein